MSQWWVDITNSSDVIIGPGPIVNGIKWRYTQRLSRAGEWSLEVPATDPILENIQLKNTLSCYTYINGTKQQIGSGKLEKRVMSMRGGEVPTMILSGNDALYDLARVVVDFEVNYNSPYLGGRTYDLIMDAAPSGWGYFVNGPTPPLIVKFVNESVLNALTAITKKTGQMFRYARFTDHPGILLKTVFVFNEVLPTDIVATNLADPIAIERNPNACLITDIERTEDAFPLVNKVIPFGAGTGSERGTIALALYWPDGTASNLQYTTTDALGNTRRFICDQVNNWVKNLDSWAALGGDDYTAQIQFPDIIAITPDPLDLAAAADALLAAAVQSLLKTSFPQEHYNISVVGLRKLVYPGETIRVVAKQMRDGKTPINIDTDLIILETVTEVDASGVRTVGLTVATTNEFAATDEQILSNQFQKVIASQSHPQPGPNENTISYSEDIDDEHGGEFPFWLSVGTRLINSVIVRFKLSKLRSTVKSVGDSDVPIHVPLPSHRHHVDVGSHTHPVDNHQHDIPFEPGSGGSTVQIFSGGGSPDVGSAVYNDAGLLGHTVFLKTSTDSGAITMSNSTNAVDTSDIPTATADSTLDLSGAIRPVYGIYEDTTTPHGVGDLTWTINGIPISSVPESIGGGYYKLDITSYVIDPLTARPLLNSNTIGVAVTYPQPLQENQKRVRVTVQTEIRTSIQSIAAI